MPERQTVRQIQSEPSKPKGREKLVSPEPERQKKVVLEIGSGGEPYIKDEYHRRTDQLDDEDRDSPSTMIPDDVSRYILLNNDPDEARAAKNFVRRMKSDVLLARNGDARKMAWPDESIDLVICRNIWSDTRLADSRTGRINYVVEMLREISRVLRVGGQFLIKEHYTPELFVDLFGRNIQEFNRFIQSHAPELECEEFLEYKDIGERVIEITIKKIKTL